MAVNAALIAGLAIAAASAAAAAAPKAGEKYNKEQIRELKARKEAGELGLTQQEKDAMWGQTYAPAEAKVREQRVRGEAAMAAAGGTSGGAMAAQQAASMNATAAAATQAGQAISEMDVAEREAENQELDDRLAVQDQVKRERRQALISAAGKVASTLGRYGGETGRSLFDRNKPSAMDGYKVPDMSNMTPEEAEFYTTSLEIYGQADPELRKQIDDMYRAKGWVPPSAQGSLYSDGAAGGGGTVVEDYDPTTAGYDDTTASTADDLDLDAALAE